MEKYFEIFINSYHGYFNYLWKEITHFHWENYFYGLLLISLLVWGLELLFPWRKNQKVFRKDFWLDTFYMFFNFFLLNLIVLIFLSNATAELFNDVLGLVGLKVSDFQLLDLNALPFGLGLLIFFLVTDFVQWNTHRLLHRVPFLWNFHKLHHSVKEMGFAAHLRYHWMEPVVYKSLLYVPLAIIGGFDVEAVAIVHFTVLAIGHLNHANIGWDYGIFKYVFNNPKMHVLLAFSSCEATLAPAYDQAIVGKVTESSDLAMRFFAEVDGGTTNESFAMREPIYNTLIGAFESLKLQAKARPVPNNTALEKINELLKSKGSGAISGEYPSAFAFEQIALTFKKMKETDREQGIKPLALQAFKGQVEIFLDQAITYESFLKR